MFCLPVRHPGLQLLRKLHSDDLPSCILTSCNSRITPCVLHPVRCIVVPLCLDVISCEPDRLLPESPRYLALRGRNDEALQVLARLHACGNIHDSFVVAEHHEIVTQVRIEQKDTRNAWTQLFTVKSNFRRLVLGIAIQFR